MTQGFSWRCPGLFLFSTTKFGSPPGAPHYCWAARFDALRQGMFVVWKTLQSVN
jgi:hypothetical protein